LRVVFSLMVSLLLGAPCVGALVCCPHYASVGWVVRWELSFVT